MRVRITAIFMLIAVTVIAATSVGVYKQKGYIFTSAKVNNRPVIILDAGHPELVRHYIGYGVILF